MKIKRFKLNSTQYKINVKGFTSKRTDRLEEWTKVKGKKS